jgi:hypothetical protein
MKQELLVQVLKNIKKEGYYCLVTELDKLDEDIMRTAVFDHWETAVVDCVHRVRSMFGNPDVKIRISDDLLVRRGDHQGEAGPVIRKHK